MNPAAPPDLELDVRRPDIHEGPQLVPRPMTLSTPPVEIAAIRTRKQRKGEHEAEEITGPVRILFIEIRSFGPIKLFHADLNETGITLIGGDNNAGKTSVLKAFEVLFKDARSVPKDPVRHGDPRTEIIAAIKNESTGDVYQIKAHIKPDRSIERFEVLREDGTAVPRPKEFLLSLGGVVWIDGDAVLRQTTKEFVEALRRTLGLDFSKEDSQRAKLYEERTLIGRELRQKKALVAEVVPWPDAPEIEQSSTDLEERRKAIEAHNAEIDAAAAKLNEGYEWRTRTQHNAEEAEAEAERIQANIEQLQETLKTCTEQAAKIRGLITDFMPKLEAKEAAFAKLEKWDNAEVLHLIDNREEINRKVRDNNTWRQARFDAEAIQEQYDAFTRQIQVIDEGKRRQLAEAPMPEGLAFDLNAETNEIDCTLKGVPLDGASTSDRNDLMIGCAMIEHPKMPLFLLNNGELYGTKRLAEVCISVTKRGAQLIVAKVTDDPASCDLYIEAGAVKEAAV